MRRPWWHSAGSALLGLWFALVMVEPAALHSCPMHSQGHAHVAAGDPAAAHGEASHGTLDGAAVDRHPVPSHPGAKVCTCLGDCSGSLAARLPDAHVAVAALTRLTQVVPGRPQHEYVAAWVDFVLPFATAPPALLAT